MTLLRKTPIALLLASVIASLSLSVLAGCSGKRNPKNAPPIAAGSVETGKLPEPGAAPAEGE